MGPFIEFMRANFDTSGQLFVVSGDVAKFPVEPGDDFVHVDAVGELALLAAAGLTAQKIVLHGLISYRINRAIFLLPHVWRKSYWVIWGADLYRPEMTFSNWRTETVRRFVMRQMSNLICVVPGDYEVAKRFGASGIMLRCNMYPSNLFRVGAPSTDSDAGKPLAVRRIQVGNSAHPSNNHISALRQLKAIDDGSMEVYIPLTYGPPEHASTVADAARGLFGGRAFPLLEHMPLSSYTEFQKAIDIAVFPAERQQAMGNIIGLLGMGKTVYLPASTSHSQLFQSIGVAVRDLRQLSVERISESERQRNVSIISTEFSAERLRSQLYEIFVDERSV